MILLVEQGAVAMAMQQAINRPQIMRMVVHFNRLKPYLPRPAQLRLKLHDVNGVACLPVDLNVGERVVMESPTARVIDALPGDPAQTDNAAVINRESNRRPTRSIRNSQASACMGDFLVGKEIDNTLPPLGSWGEACNVAKRPD